MELRFENVTKKFGEFSAVDNINITMEKGVYGLLGVNGAGKTTLMRMLCTLLPPSQGKIIYEGKDIFSMGSSYRDLLGYLPQDFGFYPDFTVRDYLNYIGSIKGICPGVAKRQAEDLIGQVDLSKAADKKMKKLSGGMKRRAGIAQALMNNPKILVLDEPTAGLDPNERIRFRNLLSEIAGQRIVLLSTHIVSDVEYIANEIFLMKEGKISYSGSGEELVLGMGQQVWICYVKQGQVRELMKSYKISNMRAEGDTVELRVISKEKPCENALLAKGTLEDVFLYYFGEREENRDEENDLF